MAQFLQCDDDWPIKKYCSVFHIQFCNAMIYIIYKTYTWGFMSVVFSSDNEMYNFTLSSNRNYR